MQRKRIYKYPLSQYVGKNTTSRGRARTISDFIQTSFLCISLDTMPIAAKWHGIAMRYNILMDTVGKFFS